MRLVLALLVFAPLLSGILPASAAALSPYVVTDLGTFGGPVSTPMDLNEAGQVIGTAQTALPDPNDPNLRMTKAFLYDNGVLRDPQLNTCGSLTLNDSGTIFYSAPGTSGCYTSRLARSANGAITYIDTPGTYLSLSDSNSREQVLGSYLDTTMQRYVSFLYANGVAWEIPDPLGGAWADWNTPASRGWYAQVLYQALDTLPSTQPIP